MRMSGAEDNHDVQPNGTKCRVYESSNLSHETRTLHPCSEMLCLRYNFWGHRVYKSPKYPIVSHELTVRRRRKKKKPFTLGRFIDIQVKRGQSVLVDMSGKSVYNLVVQYNKCLQTGCTVISSFLSCLSSLHMNYDESYCCCFCCYSECKEAFYRPLYVNPLHKYIIQTSWSLWKERV